MTLEEKAALTSGADLWSTKPIERLRIPSIFMTDGPHGVRKANGANFADSVPATCFPTAPLLASTWSVELVQEVGRALGVECQANDVQILLGPGVNMKRSPLGGRNFEYFSEDPIHTGRMAVAFIRGVQSEGVGTSLKHFAANNQEFERMVNDSIVDERSLREIYLPAFEIAVREAQPWTVMCAYNKVNGTHASENASLLDGILKREWGFVGSVVSDWGAVCDRLAGIRTGLHLEMPSSLGVTDRQIVVAVQSGALDQSRLDEVVTQLLATILRAHAARRPGTTFDPDKHHALARRVAGEGIVLLKNENLLPLDFEKTQRIAIIGTFARAPRYQGAGSSQVRPTRIDNAFEELKALAGSEVELSFAPGYAADGSTCTEMLEEAKRIAAAADVAIVFAGLPDSYESEGFDRSSIDLPAGHNRLIEAVSATQAQTAVVLMNGSAVAMPWANRVPAIVEGWLGGQAGGGAIADVLTGRVNPSGKLSETFPHRLEDTPAYLDFPKLDRESHYREGVFVGYRYYDTRKVEPLYPFGHGLSYTIFSYTSLSATETSIDESAGARIWVGVKNTGTRAGQEVVQLYVRERSPRVRRPGKELRAFAKVELAPGEEKTVELELGRRDFAFWDVRTRDWAVQSGEFDVLVGGSSRDLPLTITLHVRAREAELPPLTRESLAKELVERAHGKLVFSEMMNRIVHSINGHDADSRRDEVNGNAAEHLKAQEAFAVFIRDMPVGKIVNFTGGAIGEEDITDFLRRANGQS